MPYPWLPHEKYKCPRFTSFALQDFLKETVLLCDFLEETLYTITTVWRSPTER